MLQENELRRLVQGCAGGGRPVSCLLVCAPGRLAVPPRCSLILWATRGARKEKSRAGLCRRLALHHRLQWHYAACMQQQQAGNGCRTQYQDTFMGGLRPQSFSGQVTLINSAHQQRRQRGRRGVDATITCVVVGLHAAMHTLGSLQSQNPKRRWTEDCSKAAEGLYDRRVLRERTVGCVSGRSWCGCLEGRPFGAELTDKVTLLLMGSSRQPSHQPSTGGANTLKTLFRACMGGPGSCSLRKPKDKGYRVVGATGDRRFSSPDMHHCFLQVNQIRNTGSR